MRAQPRWLWQTHQRMLVRIQHEQRRYHANENNIVFGVVEHHWKPIQKKVGELSITGRKQAPLQRTSRTGLQTAKFVSSVAAIVPA